MKWTIIIVFIAMLLLAGCGSEAAENVVEDLPAEESSEDVIVESAEVEETPEVEEVVEEIVVEEVDEAPEVEEVIEEVSKGIVRESIIENLKATPENFNIKIGDTIKWTSQQKNYKHIIIIRSLNEDNYKKNIAGPFILLEGESVEYTFEEEGAYDWFSKPAYTKVSGDITVS